MSIATAAPAAAAAPRIRRSLAGPWVAVAAGTVVYAGVLAALRADARGPALWTAVLGGGVVMGAGLALARRAPARTAVVALVVGAVAFRALLLFAPPQSSSTDIFRYLWDGRVQGAAISPYRYAPDHPALAELRDEAVWPRVNRSEAPTIYPPAAQAVFFAAWRAGLRSPQAFKTLVVAADLAALGMLLGLLRREGREQCWAIAYAWNPAVLIGFAVAGHLESLVVLALLVAVRLWRCGHAVWAGAAVGAAASLKLYPLIALPAFLRGPDGAWRWPIALGVGGAALGALAVGYLPYLPGAGPEGVIGYLPGYLDEEQFTSGRRFLLLRQIGVDGRIFAPLAGAAIALWVLLSRAHAAARATWLLGGALVLATPRYGWYTTPVIPLALVGRAGWVWPLFAVAIEASYVAMFFPPWGTRLSIPIKRAAAGVVALVAVAGLRSGWARRAVVGQPGPPEAAGEVSARPGGGRVSAGELAGVCVVLPALDEADALPAALRGRPAGPRYLVVDNGSTDGTAEVARRLGADVMIESRRGFGHACWTGAQAARAPVIVFMDADATLDWDDLPAVAGPILAGEADLVLGRRRRDLRDPGALAWHVAAANRALAWLCCRLAGTDVHDISPFRAIRRDALLDLGLRDRTYGWPLEMVLRAGRAGLRVVEVPVRYRARAGTSKVTGRPWATMKAAVRMSSVLARHARRSG